MPQSLLALGAHDFRNDPASSTGTISFQRTSEASYYGPDGFLHFSQPGQDTVIGKAPQQPNGEQQVSAPKGENLFADNNILTASVWNKVGATISAISGIPGYVGAGTIYKLTENNATGEHRVSRGATVTQGTPVTISIYVKAGTRSNVQFSFMSATSYTGGNPGLKFDLASGTVVSKSSNVIDFQAIDSGNGWWLLKLTALPDKGTNSGLHLYMRGDSGSISYQGVADRYVYIGGIYFEQKELLSAARTVAAVSSLRFNYDLSSSPPKLLGALVEPAATNSTPYSQLITHTAWRKQYAKILATNELAPDGTNSAFKLVEDKQAGAQHYIMPYPNMPSSSGSTYTFSAFLKAGERKWAYFNINGVTVHFDLVNGVIGNKNNIFIPSIENAGNGWFRCAAVFLVTTTTTSAKIGPEPANGQPSYNGDGTSGIFVWGAQFEKSNGLTSYIRTEASSVARNEDVVTVSKPATGTSDLFLQRKNGGLWVDRLTADYRVPASVHELQIANFYKAGESTLSKDDTVEELFPFQYESVGPTQTPVTIFDELYISQTPNKDWSLRQAVNKTSPTFRFQVNPGEKWSGDAKNPKARERCEVYKKSSSLPFNEDVWMAYSLRIEPGQPQILSPSDWCYLGQMHATEDPGEMSTGPVLGFRLEGLDSIKVYTAANLENPIKTEPKYILRGSGVFTRGVWHNVVVRMRFSPTNGQLQWWQNGVELLNISGVGMGYVDAKGPYWKFGIYRCSNVSIPTLAVEYSNMELVTGQSLLSRVKTPLPIV
ncbi:phage head spike fiber domain-containing protein [Dyadobacter bucti]|uniref:phage head spike fiber domain-containing protein n=1 Tax=Dyadobacter bucti TaxID=2572203 RepID=UPI001108CC36|nr:heparin lyase I family protein [Dyadobacter bucti]